MHILEEYLWADVGGISGRWGRKAVFLTKHTYSTCLSCGRSSICTSAWTASLETELLVLISNLNTVTLNKSFKAQWGCRAFGDEESIYLPHLTQEIQFAVEMKMKLGSKTSVVQDNIMVQNIESETNHWQSLVDHSYILFWLAVQHSKSVALIIQYNQARTYRHLLFRMIDYILCHFTYSESWETLLLSGLWAVLAGLHSQKTPLNISVPTQSLR